MEPGALVAAMAVGFAAGTMSGVLGIGGGILFVPALALLLELSQLEAQATSLVAVVIVSVAGAARQRREGNLRLREALLVGALSPLGVAAGTVLANVLPERLLELLFAAFLLYFAYRLGRRALRPEPQAQGSPSS